MILPESIEERRPLTKSFPVLIASYPGGGKSSAVEFLSDEEKARTVIINYDNKALPEDEESKYFKVKYLNDESEPKDKRSDVFQSLDSIRKSIASPKVDRVIIDTFSGYFRELDAFCNKRYNGFDVWKNYNGKIDELMQLIKTETATHCKFVYVYAHYKPVKKETGERQVVSVKGNEWYALVEGEFNTVIEAVVENGQFKFVADNADEFTSTRIRKALSPLETTQNSLAELELKLASLETK